MEGGRPWIGSVTLGESEALGSLQVAGIHSVPVAPPMMRFDDFLNQRLKLSQPYFSLKEACELLDSNPAAIQQAISRRRADCPEILTCPSNGFFVIGKKDKSGCRVFPSYEEWVPAYMAFRRLEYRVSVLSAAKMHGARLPEFKAISVIIPCQVKWREGAHGLSLIMQKRAYFMAVDEPQQRQIGAHGFRLPVSTLEVTLLDCLKYSNHARFDLIRIAVRQLGADLQPELLANNAEH